MIAEVGVNHNGDPALVELKRGPGRVLVLTSGWHPADSQLALSSKFVPLLHALLEQSASLPAQRAQYFVGDEVPLEPLGAVQFKGKGVAVEVFAVRAEAQP